MTITADQISSTDSRFTMDDINLGDNYKPLDTYFKDENGTIIHRSYNKGERRNTNQTLPWLACQIFEKQISGLSVEGRENFPICQYNPDSDMIRGIYFSVDEYKEKYNNKTWEYLTYSYDNGRMFVLYSWNIFSTLTFVQECLKRFGKPGEEFVLTYREKDKKETEQEEADTVVKEELVQQFRSYRNPYSSMLIESKNIIFHGAPVPENPIWQKKVPQTSSATGILMITPCCQMSRKSRWSLYSFIRVMTTRTSWKACARK